MASDARVTIAAGGSVVGRLTGAEVLIEGRLQGDATGTKSLSIAKSAEVRGDVSTGIITIEPGATFVGRCSMLEATPQQTIATKS